MNRTGLLACRWVLCIAAVFSLAAAEPPAASVRSLRLVPQDWTLWGAKASQQFLALATYSDGLERDVTANSTFSISDPKVAAVDVPAVSWRPPTAGHADRSLRRPVSEDRSPCDRIHGDAPFQLRA